MIASTSVACTFSLPTYIHTYSMGLLSKAFTILLKKLCMYTSYTWDHTITLIKDLFNLTPQMIHVIAVDILVMSIS